MQTQSIPASGYRLLSRYRSELMGLAMLYVMLFHAYKLHFGVLLLDGFRSAGFAGVDIFLLLSGMGLYLSLEKGPRLSAYYARRMSRVLPAYWLAVGAYSLWLCVRGRISLKTALWSLSALHYWFHIPDTFNWYVPALLAFYLLSPLFARAVRRCPRPLALTLAAIPASYGLYRLSIPLGLNYMADFLYRIPTFAMGCFAGRCLAEDRPLTRRQGAVWAALAACGVIMAALLWRQVFYIDPCYVVTCGLVPVCLLLGRLLDVIRWEKLNRFLRMVGENSLEIYLLNVVFTRELNTLPLTPGRGPVHILCYLAGWTLNILLGLALHRGVEEAKSRLLRRRETALR